MNRKATVLAVLIGALSLPLVAYSADTDTDRSHPKTFVKDAAITTKIKAKMAMDDQVSAMHIKVDTDNNGVVTLSGTAKSQAEVAKAVSIARSTEGVREVQNHILVAAER